ncbi:hypothetical protein COV82_00665 [Candidatus Peregrinibacteria bacterium CG11_big_fil_rev_8_21_14_0_20_46_8]|nr:MAG: hypothetical protein COV82_00665 [Candidatus Peregrinibacteria bacterium CG11_big_fil_rev_8_21_14_0_20_46_8]
MSIERQEQRNHKEKQDPDALLLRDIADPERAPRTKAGALLGRLYEHEAPEKLAFALFGGQAKIENVHQAREALEKTESVMRDDTKKMEKSGVEPKKLLQGFKLEERHALSRALERHFNPVEREPKNKEERNALDLEKAVRTKFESRLSKSQDDHSFDLDKIRLQTFVLLKHDEAREVQNTIVAIEQQKMDGYGDVVTAIRRAREVQQTNGGVLGREITAVMKRRDLSSAERTLELAQILTAEEMRPQDKLLQETVSVVDAQREFFMTLNAKTKEARVRVQDIEHAIERARAESMDFESPEKGAEEAA